MILKINGLLNAIYPVTSGFGAIDSAHMTPHTGVDIGVPEGTLLHSIIDGIVTESDGEGARSLGRMVRIDGGDTDVIYGHLSAPFVKVGDHVRAGDIIGISGNTGHTTGPHVHVEMITDGGAHIDPSPYVHYVTSAMAEPKSWLDHLNDFSDWFIGKEAELIVRPAAHGAMTTFERMAAVINYSSAEIITLGIIVCAAGVMVGSLIGGGGNKWVGRLFVVFWGGVIWRVLT